MQQRKRFLTKSLLKNLTENNFAKKMSIFERQNFFGALLFHILVTWSTVEGLTFKIKKNELR